MVMIIGMTIRGIFRDRVFQGIIGLGVIFLLIPMIASLSMRQVTELSITMSLSLISAILLLLAIFLGATSLWKDIERRYTFSVLSLPISRTEYIIGRFCGISLFLIMTSGLLGAITLVTVKVSSALYPPAKPIVWSILVTAIIFDAFKYILIVAVALLLSTVSTSFFLPIFGTICIFWVGTITQQVYDYLHTPASLQAVSVVVRQAALVMYYVAPNLESFDLKVNAIYSLPLDIQGLTITLVYFSVYCVMLLAGSAVIFARREMK